MLSSFFRSFSSLIPLLILISLSFHGSNAASVFFSKGNLTVQAQTNYAFQLVLNKAIPANEVVTVTFSSGYTLPSGTPSTCLLGSTTLSGCTCSSLSCSLTFPALSAQTITLELGTITNPSALTSISFVFSSTTLGTLSISSSKLIEGSLYVLSATVETPKVQETTSYTIKFQLTYAIPQGGSIAVKFPSDTTSAIYASSTEAIMTYANGTSITYACTSQDEEKVTISAPFANEAYTDVSNPLIMTLNKIENQQSVGTSSSITIETFNSASQGINIQVFTVSITQAGTTTYEYASVSGDTTINTATEIDIQFSFDISFVDTVSGPYYYVSIIFPDEFTVTDSSTCSAIGGLVSPNMPSLTTTCAVIDSHTLYLEYVIYNSQNSPVILYAYNIQTPYSTRPLTSPIQIAVYMSSAKALTSPQLLAQGNYTWDWTATPGTLTINSITRTVDTLGSDITLTYDLTLPDTIDQGSLIVIDIPENQAVFSSTPTCKKSSGSALTCTMTQDSDLNTQIIISNYCSDSTTCVSGAEIVFTLSGTVTNPQYVQLPEGTSMNISTKTADGLYYFHQNTGDIFASPSLVPNVPTDLDYQKTGTQYQVVNEPFTLSMEFTPYERILEGGYIYLHFPTEAIYKESSSSLSCSYKDSDSNSGTGDCYIEYHSDGTSFATIGLEICSDLESACVAPLTFTITGIKNPGNNKPIPSNNATNPWVIETGLSLDKRIDYKVLTSELPNITIIPNTFALDDLTISSPLVDVSSEYALKFTIATPIPASSSYNSRIIITIPSDMSIQSSSCTATLADSTTLSCVQGTNLVTISSASSLAADSTITLTLTLLNPANTKPSSAITLKSVSTIDSVDYLIDTLYNSEELIITATAGTFSDVSLQVSPQTVGSKAQNTFMLTPTTNIPPYSQYSSRIVIELPGTMVFLNLVTLPKCSANTTSGVKLSCACDSDSTPQTITISHTDSSLDLAGVPITVVVPANTIQSPTSTKPTSEIIIRSISTIDSVDYPIDDLTSGFINDQVNQPAPITVYSAVKNNSRTNQTTDLTVTFTPINTITSANVIALSLPKQQIILSSDLSGLNVLYNSAAIPVLTSDEDDTFINITINNPCDSCSENISFKITGFVNPSEIVKFTQSVLLYTKTSDQLYLIDAVTSGFNTTPKLSSGDLIDLTFKSSSNVVGTATTVTITFSIATEISTAGQLSITFPDEFMFTSGSGISCKNTLTSSSLYCLSTDGTSDYPNPISAISIIIGSQCQSSCAKGTQFSLSISGLKNAFSTKAYSGSIDISTVDDGSTVDTDEVDTTTLPALVAGALEVTKLTRDSSSISASTSVTLSIELATLIISTSKLYIDFSESNSLVLASTTTPTCSLVTSSATSALSCANQGTNSLVISGLCSSSKSPCAAGSSYTILLTGAQNVDYVKSPLDSSDSVIVTTTDSEGNTIDEADSGIVVSPALQVNDLVVKNSAMTNRDINSVADWSFVITLATPLKTPNQLYIQLPESTLLKSSSSAISCKTSASTSTACSVSLYSDSSLGIESLAIQNLCGSSTTCSASQSLTITIKNLLNPPAVYTTNGDITFSTQNSDSNGDFYTTDIASDDWVSLLGSLVPGDITIVSMAGNLPYASVLTNVTTTFYNVDPIPLDGVLVMKLPSELIIPNFVESEQKCINILGFNSSLQCRLEDSQLTLTNAFSTNQQASVFSFKLLNILNPISPTFTSGVANIKPFNLTIQDDNAYLIDQSPNFSYTLITRDSNLTCDSTCLTCTQTSTHCTSCKTPSDYPLLYNNTCVASCPTGTISQSGVCVSCYPNCASCSGASSNQCLSCSSPYFLSDGSCVTTCPSTTIADEATGTCVRNETATDPNTGTEVGGCTDNCATCSTSSDYCLSCDSPYVLDTATHTCIDPSTTSCSDSYYFDSTTNTCEPCDSSCTTCTSSATQCTTCNPLFHPYLDTTKTPAQCVDTCPTSTYVDSENRCVACDSTCLTCSGPSSTQCTSCDASSLHPLLQYGQCVSSCSSGYVLSNDGLTCLLPCTDSHCYQCQENSLGTCITCEDGYYLSNGKCKAIETCSSGQYWNTTTNACAACNPSCKTCSGSASNCTSCYTDYTLPLTLDPSKLEYLYNGQCLQACPLGYTPDYSNDKKCEEYECNSPCETCSGESDKCYTCLDEYPYLYEDYCYETCPAGTTASKNKYGLTCEQILLQSKYKLSPAIIALTSGTGFSMFLLIFANVFYRKRGQGVNNRNALLVLLQILEVISKVMLIPNIWGIEHGLLFFTALTLFFNVGLGVNLNILYMPLYENHVQSIKGYMEENKRLLKTTKALTYAGGSNILRMYGSGLFARQGGFEKVAQFRELEKKHSKMSLYVVATQIVVDIVIMSLVNVRKDAFGISVFNLVFNAVIWMCLLSDVVNFSAVVAKLFGKKNKTPPTIVHRVPIRNS